MKKIFCFFIASFFLLTTNIFAQDRNCVSAEYLQLQLQKNPSHAQKLAQLERLTNQRAANQSIQRRTGHVIYIPVVVHVLWNSSNPIENLSDAQIESQIQVINKDFRRLNDDADNVWPQAADMEIEFYLAQVDPDGSPTNGITRTETSVTDWGFTDDMKSFSNGGVDPWDTTRYFNFWTANIGGGILGFAQFPGGQPDTDGIVMSPQFFGSSDFEAAAGETFYLSPPFDKGRTTTHEIGHFLNLIHIWGDGGCGVDDLVDDTPESDDSNGGCQIGSESCGSVDMVQNYMDYTDDACMNLFTEGQKNRMRAVLEPGGPRESLAQDLSPFTITLEPSNLEIIACSFDDITVNFDIEIAMPDTTGDVTFSASGLPTGVSTSFNPNTVSVGNVMVTLTLSNFSDTTLGEYTIVIEATDGSFTATESIMLFTFGTSDNDGDGIGDECDDDDDNDGVLDINDNCQFIANADQADNDGDGQGDVCDDDDDNDSVMDSNDNCPFTANSDQADVDFDGTGDVCDDITVNDILTPNSDGVNDTWTIFSIERFPGTVVRVFNRWGNEVFMSNNYNNDWRGTHKDGNTLPAGSYYYQIDQSGNGATILTGWLLITF